MKFVSIVSRLFIPPDRGTVDRGCTRHILSDLPPETTRFAFAVDHPARYRCTLQQVGSRPTRKGSGETPSRCATDRQEPRRHDRTFTCLSKNWDLGLTLEHLQAVQKVDTGRIYAMKTLEREEMFRRDRVCSLCPLFTLHAM